ALDARIDFGMYQAKTWGRELYERFTVLMDRFHVAGWRRWCFVEPLSEGLTLGNGGLLLLLALSSHRTEQCIIIRFRCRQMTLHPGQLDRVALIFESVNGSI